MHCMLRSMIRVVLTAPDVDKLCAGKAFKVCVPVDVVKDRVHREIERGDDDLEQREEPQEPKRHRR